MTFFPALPFFSLLVAMLLWGSSFVAFKYAVMIYDPVVVVLARMIISAFLFLLVCPLFLQRLGGLLLLLFLLVQALGHLRILWWVSTTA